MAFKPKFIYFDLDDTLLDHKQAARHALHDIHSDFELFAASDIGQLVDIFHGINKKQWTLYSQDEVDRYELQHNRFALTLQKLGLDEKRADEVGDRYLEYYQDHWQWIDGARKAFQQIRKQYSVGILTNGFVETQEKKFNRFDFYNLAEHLVISEKVGALKPHPSVFEYATNLTEYNPEEILYIGDSYQSDVLGGHNFGWKIGWYTKNADAEKHEKADFVFNDFKYLTDMLKVKS